MQAPLSAAVALGLTLALASASSSAAADHKLRRHVRHVRADKTFVPAPMQVDTSTHPRVDMLPGMQGIPTNTNLPADFAKKRR